jgi:hypothetical protein
MDQLDIALVYRNDRFLRGGDHTLAKMDSRPFVKEMKTTSNSIRTCEQKITWRFTWIYGLWIFEKSKLF